MKLFIIILRHYIMKIFRIKNDLPIEWTVKRLGKPETLAGKELKVFLTNIYGDTEIKDYLVQDNVIRFVFEGAAQIIAGKYGLKLIENQDGEGMVTIEACDAFCLTDGCVDACDRAVLAVESNIVVPANGLSAYEIAVLHGYEGTEEEFVDWIRRPAINAAKEANNAANEARKAIQESKELFDAKQDKLDDTLETEDKSITGAINELQKSKQNKLVPGTGIAIQGNVISCTLDESVFVVKESLPERPETGKENKIYVVPNPDGQGDNVYDEYAWINGAWEKVGEFKADVDLSAYQTKQDDSLQTEAKTVVGAINELQAGKLDVANYFSKMGSSAMRPIYEACGAVWNEETGYYELNGLTDITEEEMMWIYIETFGWWKSADGPICRYCRKARTNIRPMTYGVQFNERAIFPFSEGIFETLNFDMYPNLTGGIYTIAIFNNVKALNTCRKLTVVTGVLLLYKYNNTDFEVCSTCPLLREIRLRVSNNSGSFCKDSPLLSYESVQYLVDNAANTAAITVTVHPTTYSYLAGTAQPTEEVGGTTEEWQALMTAAAGKQISFATEE